MTRRHTHTLHTPLQLLQRLLDVVIPYYINRVKAIPRNKRRTLRQGIRQLSLPQRRVAVQLTREMAEGKVIQRVIDGVTWFYARKFILGDVRPRTTERDVTVYEEAMQKAKDGTWTMAEFNIVTRIYKYNSNECSCVDYPTYGNCVEVHATQLYEGQVPAQEQDFSDARSPTIPTGIHETTSRSTHAQNRGQASATTCYMCNRRCQNPRNLQSHYSGKEHCTQAKKVWSRVQGEPDRVKWGKHNLVRVIAADLHRGDIVLVLGDPLSYEVLQGVVSAPGCANQSGHVYVGLAGSRECVLAPDHFAYRVEVHKTALPNKAG
jgi:hypothetical protein